MDLTTLLYKKDGGAATITLTPAEAAATASRCSRERAR